LIRLSEDGIFLSLQGEGLYAGEPTVFIRFQSCNLFPVKKCCTYCLPRGQVWTSKGEFKDIREVKVGDKLLAWSNSSVVETLVEEVLSRQAPEILKIYTGGKWGETIPKILEATPEHPILTVNGWKEAGSLKASQDELYYLPYNKAQSFRMSTHNPMSNPEVSSKKAEHTNYKEVGRKVSEFQNSLSQEERDTISTKMLDSRKLFNPTRYIYPEASPKAPKLLTPSTDLPTWQEIWVKSQEAGIKLVSLSREEVGQLNSERMKVSNPMFNPETRSKVGDSNRGRKRGPFTEEHNTAISEAKLANPTRLWGDKNPNWKGGISYYGYGLSLIARESILERDRYTCQEKDCLNSKDLVVHHKDFNKWNISDDNLVTLCRSHNSSINHGRYTLVLKSGGVCPSLVELNNGLSIVAIDRFEGETEVFNLRCSPYNNYFVDGLLVHNCDTKYAQGNGGQEVTVEEIVKRVRALGPMGWVCITGGEPLNQADGLEELVEALNSLRWRVEIETNGTIPIPHWYEIVDSWSADIK
jgi:organic radical activating enzyme